MASFFYNKALVDILTGVIDLDTDVLKMMLVNSTYTANRDDDVVDAGTGTDAESGEIVATNYTRGWGGAGRKTVTITVTEQDANDRAVVILADITWTALGGATNDTAVAAVLIKEGVANDTTSRWCGDIPGTSVVASCHHC